MKNEQLTTAIEMEEPSFTTWEKIVLSLFLALILFIFSTALWSGLLLMLNQIDGGGPLGLLSRVCRLHLLL